MARADDPAGPGVAGGLSAHPAVGALAASQTTGGTGEAAAIDMILTGDGRGRARPSRLRPVLRRALVVRDRLLQRPGQQPARRRPRRGRPAVDRHVAAPCTPAATPPPLRCATSWRRCATATSTSRQSRSSSTPSPPARPRPLAEAHSHSSRVSTTFRRCPRLCPLGDRHEHRTEGWEDRSARVGDVDIDGLSLRVWVSKSRVEDVMRMTRISLALSGTGSRPIAARCSTASLGRSGPTTTCFRLDGETSVNG